MAGSSDPTRRILQEIRTGGPMPFARFMELALYATEGGYYNGGGAMPGRRGDFYTASDVGHEFGRAVARQLAEIDRQIGPCEPFDVIEFGAGRGLLARDVLDSMEEIDGRLAGRLRYRLVDRSAAMRDEARRCVPEGLHSSPEELPGGLRGCVIAVELFDALPVHRVRRRAGELVEVFVDADGTDQLVEVESACSPEVQRLAERHGAAAEEGSEAEVVPLATRQLQSMAECLDSGVMLIVDYGDRSERLYAADRSRGTLLAYHEQTTNEDYLRRVGRQDLTAHVNFSALEEHARSSGLEVLGLTTQDRFLIANGILEAFDPGAQGRHGDPRQVKRRLQAMQLIHPAGMGRMFKVLMLALNCSPRLAGLRDPFGVD